MRCCYAVLGLLGLLIVAVPANSTEYTYRDGFYWNGNAAYTRTQYYYPGYRTCYGYVPGYYSYSYVYDHTYTPPASYAPEVPAYGPDWQTAMVNYAKKRDDLATYLLALKALGVNGQQYAFQQGYYGYSAYTPAYQSSATQYGYSYKQLAEAYGTTDLNALFQQSARLAQGAQEGAAAANGLFNDNLKLANSGQATVAKIIAEGEARRKVLEASKLAPSAQVETVVEGAASGGAAGVPSVPAETAAAPPTAGLTEQQFLALRIQRCGACHSGPDAKAKLDMTKAWTAYDTTLRATIMARLTTIDPEKRMPRTKDGKPADLPFTEKVEFLRRTQ